MNNINSNNEIRNQNNQCLSAPVIDRISNIKKENDKMEPNSKDKKEIDFLIDHFKITSNVFMNSDKGEKSDDIKQEKNSPFPYLNDNDNNQENPIDNNVFLQKKLEREQGIIDIESDNCNDNFKNKKNNNNDISFSENKKGKNKKKKANNKNQIESEKFNNDKIDKNMPLKEEIINLPILYPIENKENNQNKNDDKHIIDEDTLKLLLEDNDNDKNDKKDKNTNSTNSNNVSLEILFSLELEKEFSEIKPKNEERVKVIENIISIIKNKDKNNKKINPKIQGPYLVGSYNVIPNLSSLNYSTPIDIMYKYKDIPINKQIIDNTINDIIKNCLNLLVVETSDRSGEKIIKIFVKCINSVGVKIDFAFYFVNIGLESNEKIINDIVLGSEIVNIENKNYEKKFITVILFLRTWRKKNNISFIIPEILDEIAKKYFDPNKAIALVIFHIFYDLYNCISDLNTNKKQEMPLNHRLFIENLIKSWYVNKDNCQVIKKAVLETHKILNNKNFKILFNNSEDK